MHAQKRTFAALALAAIAVGLHWPVGPAAFSLDDLAFEEISGNRGDFSRAQPSLRANYLHVPYERLTVDAVDMEWRPGSRQLYLKKPLGEREELVPEMRASSDVEADDVDEN